MSKIPTFAFVGDVNLGKTSVLATLLEDDGLRISKKPGETTECQRFVLNGDGGEPVCAFYDTPGFQNSRNTLKALQDFPNESGRPLDRFRKFVEKYANNSEYAEECKLFTPIIEGAGIIYVVDASLKVTQGHEAEMQILKMSGRPVLGLINWKVSQKYMQNWTDTLNVNCGLSRKFNAHQANYFERIALIETLIGLEESWAPSLKRAVTTFENAWNDRRSECAAIISEMIFKCLRHIESSNGIGNSSAEKLQRKYETQIKAIEKGAHEKIVKIFKHRKVKVGGEGITFEQDLFSETTWKVLGLNQMQLVLLGTAAGAAAGVTLDAVLLGHGFGIPTIVGSATGGLAAFFGGKKLTEVKIPISERLRRLTGLKTFGGENISIGPNRAISFPWILMDRAFLLYHYLIHRAHARQDQVTLDLSDGEMPDDILLSKRWEEKSLKDANKIFSLVGKGKVSSNDLDELNLIISDKLRQIVSS